jgi:hypothetical protein
VALPHELGGHRLAEARRMPVHEVASIDEGAQQGRRHRRVADAHTRKQQLVVSRRGRASPAAHHLDLEFYDGFFKPGVYGRTHRDHMTTWHREVEKKGYTRPA